MQAKMQIKKNDIIFILSLITAVWFSFFGMIWMYWGALFIAYPAGLISFLLWRSIRNENGKRTRFIPIILVIGLVLSLAMLVGLLLWD